MTALTLYRASAFTVNGPPTPILVRRYAGNRDAPHASFGTRLGKVRCLPRHLAPRRIQACSDCRMTFSGTQTRQGSPHAEQATNNPLIDQILSDYDALEPGESDAWIPIGCKYQIGLRLNIYYSLSKSLGSATIPLRDLRVIDLGCGTGRSARVYIDMGLRPEQIRGLDFRPGAIALARMLNPAIQWDVYDGEVLPPGCNWISAATVFSSVASPESRQAIVGRIWDALPSGGYMFYYDFRKANPFAGGDLIEPHRLFRDFTLVWGQRFGRCSTIPAKDRLLGLWMTGFRGDDTRASLRELLGDALAPSHEALLFQKA